MRKYKKKQLLETLETLNKANEAVRRGKCKNKAQVVDMLAQCQELVIEIGNDIEGGGEEFRPLIRELEEYCELCYQLSLAAMDKASRNRLTKKIRSQLIAVRERILWDLPEDKREIVFLPYKASMWDSLESVWMAARDDKTVQTSVIPIPYFDKNPDGSLGEMHYEGGQYPEYVPVIRWQDYDIQSRRPEVVFIHNPYDDENYVTSVHPLFYAKRLRASCRLLCYIPYFICSDQIDFVATGKEHMCATKGILQSDYMFVQSEHVKQAYISAMTKIVQGHNRNVIIGALNKKILPLGSPKLDKVIRTKREDFQLPDQWLNQIGNKEVILFNTTINACLHYGQQYLDKLHKILEIFRKRKHQALWWRPHPLLQQTFASMRPRLAAQYAQITEEYCREGWGIYDESPNLHRAIAWSDRYYGDRGSLIWLYGMTGKPVLISSIQERKRETLEVAGWYTADVEKDDLENWLDKKEKWKLTKTFADVFPYGFAEGDSGKSIYEFIQRNEL
ncbi:MAG: hypothetical protein LIP16_08575 [Clostridium sp.]|nr:hypothetical protein [Clostridium sp.]